MNYTQEQIEGQFDLLPDEVQDKVFSPEIEIKVQKIGVDTGLLIDQIKKLNTLVNFVILELLPEEEFTAECQKVFNIGEADAQKLVDLVSREVFGPIKATRIQALKEKALYETEEKELFSTEAEEEGEEETIFEKLNIPPERPTAPARVWEKEPDVAPDNLPVADEVEPLIPPIPEKVSVGASLSAQTGEETPAHPFEEKMKQVFTAGQQSMGDLSIESAPVSAPMSVVPPVPLVPDVSLVPPRPYHADPYREAIE